MQLIFKRIKNYFYKNFQILFLIIGFIFAFIGNYLETPDKINKLYFAIDNTISLFALNAPNKINFMITMGFIFIFLGVSGIILQFLPKWIGKLRFRLHTIFLNKKNNVLIFGFNDEVKQLIEINLNSEYNFFVFFEQDNKEYMDFLNTNNIPFIVINIDNLEESRLERIIDNFEYIIFMRDNDKENIELVQKFSEIFYNEKTTYKTIVCQIKHNNLDNFLEKILSGIKSNKTKESEESNELPFNFIPYNINDEISDALFNQYLLDILPLDNRKDINTYETIIIGNGDLLTSILRKTIYYSLIPKNEKEYLTHKIKIYTFDNQIEIKNNFCYSKKKYKNIDLEIYPYNNFYDLLDDKNLSDNASIIICDKDENKNFIKGIHLFDKFKQKHKNINIYLYATSVKINSIINKDNTTLDKMFLFGDSDKIFKFKNIIDDEQYRIAKLINCYYNNKSCDDEQKVNESWFKSSLSDRKSSYYQSLYIDIKLKLLNLEKVKVNNKDINDLKKENENIFKTALIGYLDDNINCIEDNIKYKKLVSNLEMIIDGNVECINEKKSNLLKKSPKELISSYPKLFSLIDLEHKRWELFHYLHCWEYNKEKSKSLKLHNYLVDLPNLPDFSSTIHDLHSFTKIPEYLSYLGYQIKTRNANEKNSIDNNGTNKHFKR